MKVLAFSDSHCTRSSEFSKPTEDGYNEYLQACIKSFEFVAECTKNLKPEVLAFCGDFWDARDYVDTISLNVGFKIWEGLTSLDPPYKIAVVGNHDYFSICHNIHTLEFLKSLGWHVFEDPDLIDIGIKVLGVPYRDQYDANALIDWNDAKPDLVLSHCDVIGGQRRAPKSDRDGKAYSSSGLPSSIFSRAKCVLNGHYHHPSKVTDNWYNIGSLTSRTFHDKGSMPRGAVLFDTNDLEYLRLPNPHAKEFLDLHLSDEYDLAQLFEEDYSNAYARIYYNPELEDEVQVVNDLFAGARLLPVSQNKAATNATTIDLRFSLEENLQRFVDERYGDQRLTGMALEILRVAAKEHESSSSREPLEFGKVVLRNFQSIGYIEFDLRSRGVLFLQGDNTDDTGQESNGAGKSSFIEGIYWCLTGKSLRGYKGNEIIHWDSNEGAYVSLEVIVGDKTYKVVRSRRHPQWGTNVNIFLGSELVGARLATDSEGKLRELLGRSEDSLRHVCFMTSGMANRFTRLTYPQRARLLEDIIDSKPYYLCRKIADERLTAARLELSRVQGSLETMAEVRETTKDRIYELQQEIKKFDEQHLTAKHAAEIRKKELLKLIEEEKKNEIDANNALDQLDQNIEVLRSKRTSVGEDIRNVSSTVADLRAELAVVEADIARLASLRDRLACPTCEQDLNQDLVGNDYQLKLGEKDRIDLALWESKGDYDHLSGRIKKLEAASRSREIARRQAVHTIKNARFRLEDYSAKLDQVSDMIRDIESSREKYESQLVERERELEGLQPQLTEMLDEEERLEADEEALKILAKDVFDEKGVRNSILSQVAVPYINSKLPIYSQYLWGGRTLELSGSRDLKGGKSKNDIDIVFDGNRTYKGSSSGERRRVDLVVQLALNDLAAATGRSRVGLLVVDEAFDALDESGIYAAVEALRQKTAGTVLMVSHQKYAASICDKKLTFIKENRYTRLES